MDQLLIYYIVYFLIFFLNCIGLHLYKNNKNKIFGKVFLILGFVLLLSFIGFRYNVGTDYKYYIQYFDKIKLLNFNNIFNFDWEYGAVILFKLISLFFNNNKIIFFFIGILQLYPIYKINKLNDYKYLPYSILVFCFTFLPFYFNGMRQGIAISFVLLVFYYLIKKSYLKSTISFIIGFLFHKSILLFLPYIILYFIVKNEKYRKYSILITIVISIIILFFFKDLANTIDLSDYTYLINKIDANRISFLLIVLYIPKLLLLFLLFKKNNEEYSKYYGLYINGIILDIIGTSARFLSRISYYFLIFEILLFPYIIQNINNKKIRLLIKQSMYFI